jgi:hypothetical protein
VHNQTFVQSIRRSLSSLLDPTASAVSVGPLSLLPLGLTQDLGMVQDYGMAMATDVVAIQGMAIGTPQLLPQDIQSALLRAAKSISTMPTATLLPANTSILPAPKSTLTIASSKSTSPSRWSYAPSPIRFSSVLGFPLRTRP